MLIFERARLMKISWRLPKLALEPVSRWSLLLLLKISNWDNYEEKKINNNANHKGFTRSRVKVWGREGSEKRSFSSMREYVNFGHNLRPWGFAPRPKVEFQDIVIFRFSHLFMIILVLTKQGIRVAFLHHNPLSSTCILKYCRHCQHVTVSQNLMYSVVGWQWFGLSIGLHWPSKKKKK